MADSHHTHGHHMPPMMAMSYSRSMVRSGERFAGDGVAGYEAMSMAYAPEAPSFEVGVSSASEVAKEQVYTVAEDTIQISQVERMVKKALNRTGK